jgi:hypothetical protein
LPDRIAEWMLPDSRVHHCKSTMMEKSVVAVDFYQAIFA